MRSSAILSSFLELYTQYGALLARTVVAIFIYMLMKDGVVYIGEHLKNYIIFVILTPFENIPVFGYVVSSFLESIQTNDALAYQEWNEHFPAHISVEDLREQYFG
jgi:hypothetical protein